MRPADSARAATRRLASRPDTALPPVASRATRSRAHAARHCRTGGGRGSTWSRKRTGPMKPKGIGAVPAEAPARPPAGPQPVALIQRGGRQVRRGSRSDIGALPERSERQASDRHTAPVAFARHGRSYRYRRQYASQRWPGFEGARPVVPELFAQTLRTHCNEPTVPSVPDGAMAASTAEWHGRTRVAQPATVERARGRRAAVARMAARFMINVEGRWPPRRTITVGQPAHTAVLISAVLMSAKVDAIRRHTVTSQPPETRSCSTNG